MKTKIPVAYQIIINRLHEHTPNDDSKIKHSEAKRVMRFFCRIPKNLVTPIFVELRAMELLEFNGTKEIKLLKKFDCELMKAHTGKG